MKNILIIIMISLAVKLCYLLYGVISINNLTLSINSYINIIKRNDTGWYEMIAEKGYREIRDRKEIGYSDKEVYHQSEWAFFPFYPMLIRSTKNLLNLDFNYSGLIWSMLLSTLSFLGLYRFCLNFYSNSNMALHISILCIVFPFNYYFSMMYSEASFFTLLIFSFICLKRRLYIIFTLLTIPLVLVRANGLIMLLPLFLYYLEDVEILNSNSIDFKKLISRKHILHSACFLIGPIAFGLYCIFQKQMTGYYFAFSIAQTGWYRQFMFPLFSFFRKGDFATQFNSIYTILLIITSFWARKKFPLSLNVLIGLSLIFPLCSGSVTSMQRFISVIFPITMLIGYWTFFNKYNKEILVLMFGLQLVAFHFWLIGDAFSY